MEIIGYGDSVPRGIYRLHSAFRNAINFRGQKGLVVSLVTRKTGNGPLNIVMKHLPRGASRLRVTGFKLYVDENCLEADPGRHYDSSVPVRALDRGLFRKNLDLLKDWLCACAPHKSMCFLFSRSAGSGFKRPFERRMLRAMRAAARLLDEGFYAKGARGLRGLGFGLTPSGDDFLCGFLTGVSFVEGCFRADLSGIMDAVYDNALTDNVISGSFTWCAYNGRVNEKVKLLLEALSGPDRTRLCSAAGAAIRSGHTSGADFCAGLVRGCEAALREV
ncbi:MAG TPA: DUF2877 domain-containing protein [Elusimicrobiales bacterium]|nr:DUF2877 domain-containing protein [Elusimicrobiales bacterium]